MVILRRFGVCDSWVECDFLAKSGYSVQTMSVTIGQKLVFLLKFDVCDCWQFVNDNFVSPSVDDRWVIVAIETGIEV